MKDNLKPKESPNNIADDFEDLASTREMRVLSKKSIKYNYPTDFRRYDPDVHKGLTFEQVEERFNHKFVNATKKKYSKTYPQIIFQNIFTFFNMLLLFIGIALFIVQSYTDTFFLMILLLNTSIGIFQEIKAKQTIDKLSVLSTSKVKVVRNSQEVEISTSKIVLDEILVLSIGDQIPVDCIIKEGTVEINESLLTGESLPIKKTVGEIILAGSFVSSGTCYAQAERISEDTYVSKLQKKAKKYTRGKSELLHSLNLLLKYISVILVPLGICMVVVNLNSCVGETNWEKAKEVVTKTAGSLVAMIPSGLFLLVSTALAVSVISLAKHKAMVQELYSIEMLARVDCLCLDKTGTITDGTMEVEKVEILNKDFKNIDVVMKNILGAFNESNQTSLALQNYFGVSKDFIVDKVLPFSSTRKLSAVAFKEIGTYVLGAPEFILKNISKELSDEINKNSLQGYRILLLGYSKHAIDEQDNIIDTEPMALFIIKDHIREEAYDTIKWFKDNNVEIKIISGDNPITVASIAKKVGIENADKCVSLEGLSLDEIAQIATKYTVFGRVAPEQKATLIKALKLAGKTVGMTGDGVNDILAMKQADCSIAMASGSQAARNVSHLVLLDSNFASMPRVVQEGRRVINNIQNSASLFLMKTLFAMLLTTIIIVLNLFGRQISYPFSPANLYIIEFAVIGLPSFFLALQPNKNIIRGNFLKNVLLKSIPAGLALLLSASLIFLLSYWKFILPVYNYDTVIVMAGIAISFEALLILYRLCYPFNKYRLVLCGSMTIIALVLVFFLQMITKLDYHLMDFRQWIFVFIVVTITYLFFISFDIIKNKVEKK